MRFNASKFIVDRAHTLSLLYLQAKLGASQTKILECNLFDTSRSTLVI